MLQDPHSRGALPRVAPFLDGVCHEPVPPAVVRHGAMLAVVALGPVGDKGLGHGLSEGVVQRFAPTLAAEVVAGGGESKEQQGEA